VESTYEVVGALLFYRLVITTSLSFLIPSAGRDSLFYCLSSLAPQLEAKDEVLVIGDVLDQQWPQIEALVASFGSQYRYVEFAGHEHTWGHAQLNYGMEQATGAYLSFCDDDDIYVPGAVAVIRAAANEAQGLPLLFRYVGYYGFLGWVEQDVLEEGSVGGHCLVCPNQKEKLGRWADRYAGDWDFVQSTLAFYPSALWLDEVIAIARPSQEILNEVLAEPHGRSIVIDRYIDEVRRRIFLDLDRNMGTGWTQLDARTQPWPFDKESVWLVKADTAMLELSADERQAAMLELLRVLHPEGKTYIRL